jgi:hypothetical protein
MRSLGVSGDRARVRAVIEYPQVQFPMGDSPYDRGGFVRSVFNRYHHIDGVIPAHMTGDPRFLNNPNLRRYVQAMSPQIQGGIGSM